MFDIISFLKQTVAAGASDVHLQVDERPAIRKDGKIVKINMPLLTESDITEALRILMPKVVIDSSDRIFDLDFSATW